MTVTSSIAMSLVYDDPLIPSNVTWKQKYYIYIKGPALHNIFFKQTELNDGQFYIALV